METLQFPMGFFKRKKIDKLDQLTTPVLPPPSSNTKKNIIFKVSHNNPISHLLWATLSARWIGTTIKEVSSGQRLAGGSFQHAAGRGV